MNLFVIIIVLVRLSVGLLGANTHVSMLKLPESSQLCVYIVVIINVDVRMYFESYYSYCC